MKNKTIFFLIILMFLFSINKTYGDEIKFEAQEILIKEDGNLIEANNEARIQATNGIEIKSDKFAYDKIKSIVSVSGNVIIIDKTNNTKVTGDNFIYFKNDEKIVSEETVNINIDENYFVETNKIEYLIKEKIIKSDLETSMKDSEGNSFSVSKFKFTVFDKIFNGENLIFLDKNNNEYIFKNAIVQLSNKQILGKDFNLNFDKKTFGNENQDPRLKGKSVTVNDDLTIVKKGVFTTCKKNKDKCPPWVMQAGEVKHDKSKKIIEYKNAWLKVYDTPVFYFPKFFHPDPTVKRQSGFLIPKILSSNSLGTSFEIPYYKVVSESKDLTFKPRLYTDGNFILDTEYRQVNKNSDHVMDFSLNRTKGLIDGGSGSKSHFFSESTFDLNLENFDTSKIDLQIQQTSNKTYLKTYDLNSPIINNTSTLNSFVNFEASNEDLFVRTDFEAYEDLSKHDTDKYEFIFPNFELIKKINTENDLKGSLLFQTNATKKQYDTNVNETSLINDILYESNNLFTKSGLVNKYNFILKNVNTDGENSSKYKNKKDTEFFTSLMYTTSYPLKKTGELFDSFFTPKIAFRYSPNKTRNMKDDDLRIDFTNVNSFNRIGKDDAVEGGQSITLNTDYKITSKEHDELFSLGLATVFRDDKDDHLPTTSTIEKKQSNYFGNLKFTPNEYLNFDYNFSLRDNLDRSNYDFLKAEISVNNFVTTFEYLEENQVIGKKGYLGNTTTFNFDDKNSIKFGTRKNRETDLTEFYNLIYQYKNDCLVAAIEYNKEYYNDEDLKPNEELFFSITIVPFTKMYSPNIKNAQ